MKQCKEGEDFVEAVERAGGPELFARVWEEPDHLPTLEEVRDPARWVSRLGRRRLTSPEGSTAGRAELNWRACSNAAVPRGFLSTSRWRSRAAPTHWHCWRWPLPARAIPSPITSTTGSGRARRTRRTSFEKAAARFGAGFVALKVSVETGPNLEARARAARYAALPPGVATGHTQDDQAETVLLNLLRGAGPDGLAGMRAGPTHPILALRRSDTRQLCTTLALTPVEDPSNDDVAYLRNLIRHDLLPAMSAAAARDLVPILARQATHFAAESDLLDELAAALDPTDARALAAAPAALGRRAIRRRLRAHAEGNYLRQRHSERGRSAPLVAAARSAEAQVRDRAA